MNATKIVVLLMIAMVCASVGARQLEGVSKDTKLDISLPKTATTKGIGAELNVAYASTTQYSSNFGTATAADGPGGPSATGTGSGYQSTGGYVEANGPNANVASGSGGFGQAGAGAQAGPDGATSNGTANGGGSSFSNGQTGGDP